MNGLTIHGLSVDYGRKTVLAGVDAGPLPRGQITALIGPNGSGKSTLLRALAGLTRAKAGHLSLDAERLSLSVVSARSHSVVYLPQALPAGVRLQVFESVLVAARAGRDGSEYARHFRKDAVMHQAHEVLVRLGIEHLANRTLDELSGGQRQLVGIAQALVRDPQVLLLDEPLSALDMNHQFQVMALLRDITRERGMVTVIVLHDINAAMRACDCVLLLREGRVVDFGTPPAVVTAVNLAGVFGVAARIEHCSRGYAQVLIDGLADRSDSTDGF